MSISDALPEEWDQVRKDRYTDNRSSDPVNKPDHYRVGEVEAIDYIAQQLGMGVKDYLLGNVHKYLHRHRFKGSTVEDLKKTQWYLSRLIMEEEQGG